MFNFPKFFWGMGTHFGEYEQFHGKMFNRKCHEKGNVVMWHVVQWENNAMNLLLQVLWSCEETGETKEKREMLQSLKICIDNVGLFHLYHRTLL